MTTTVSAEFSIEQAAAFLRNKIEEREKERLTIALIGRGGAGKSSLINRLIGRDVCTVSVNTNETQKAERHEWNQVIFVDLPGYGTREFSLKRVMDDFSITSFDIFICCSNDKFLAEDLSIYETLFDTEKPIIFARTKCDTLYDDKKTEEELEKEITRNLCDILGREVDLLFVSSNTRYVNYITRLEKLSSEIERHSRDAGTLKAAIVYRDFRPFSKDFLLKKRQAVEEMVLQHSIIAAANGINPIPGLNISLDLANIVTMLTRVATYYGLDVIAEAKVIGSPPAWLLGSRDLVQSLTRDGITALLRTAASPALAQQVGRYIPIIGGRVPGCGVGGRVAETPVRAPSTAL